MHSDKKRITIICPVFNEQESIPIFYDRLTQALAPFQDRYHFRLLFTNNRSTDSSLKIIRSLRERDENVGVLTYSRNFGYQASLLGGLRQAKGDAVIIIDVDCEDPPELLTSFITDWEQGYDIVYGIRQRRPEFWLLELTRKLFYRLMRLIADYPTILDMAEFSLMDDKVRQHIVVTNTSSPFIRAEIAYVGFERKGIPYTRQPRAKGHTHYNLRGMMSFAMAGLLSSTTFPLRLGNYVGAVVFLANVLLVYPAIVNGNRNVFYGLVIVDLLFLIYFAMVACVYLARVYSNQLGRPLYIIDWAQSHVWESEGLPDTRLP